MEPDGFKEARDGSLAQATDIIRLKVDDFVRCVDLVTQLRQEVQLLPQLEQVVLFPQFWSIDFKF